MKKLFFRRMKAFRPTQFEQAIITILVYFSATTMRSGEKAERDHSSFCFETSILLKPAYSLYATENWTARLGLTDLMFKNGDRRNVVHSKFSLSRL